jgi:hypothetical protein
MPGGSAIGFDHRVEGEGRARFALTPAAMTAMNDHRFAGHAIAHGAAGAAALMNLITFHCHRDRFPSPS